MIHHGIRSPHVLVRIFRETQTCGWCSGTGCHDCRGTGTEPIDGYEWECGRCGAAGEDDKALHDDACPSCGCEDLIVEDDRL